MVRRGTLSSLCALVLWVGGCPRRQGPARVVYVPTPTPPAAATAPTTSPRVLVIEEPAPLEAQPASPPAAETSEQKPPPKHKPPVRTETTTPSDETATPETSLPPAEVPALEPRASAAQESALRLQIQRLQEDVRQRLGRLNEARLSANEHKTLEDARTFLAQSTRALESGDLQRGFNLARKASLLVASLE